MRVIRVNASSESLGLLFGGGSKTLRFFGPITARYHTDLLSNWAYNCFYHNLPWNTRW